MHTLEPRNRLLLSMSKADRALVWPDLEPVDLPLRLPIETEGAIVEQVYFPDAGMISVVAHEAKKQIEIGLIGREGMSGMAVVLGNHRSPHEAYVQMAGSAHRIATVRLRAALEGRGLIRARRGHIRILRRKGLLALAGSSYGLPESEYERLLT